MPSRITSKFAGIGWEALVLLTLTALCFLLVPYPERTSMTGEWFDIGWPFSTGAVKIGYVIAGGPFGMHPYVAPTAVLNLGLWVGIYFGLRRAANHETLFVFLRVALRVIFYVCAMLFAVAATIFLISLHRGR